MKKIFLLATLLLLAAGCQTKSVSDATPNGKTIQTVPEAIDTTNSEQHPDCIRAIPPKSGATFYRNDNLDFEFQPGKNSFDPKQSSATQAVFVEPNVLVSGGEPVYSGSVSVEKTDLDFAKLKTQLQKDPTVDNVHEFQVDCEPALEYQAQGGQQTLSQVQMIHKGNLYTFDGIFTDRQVLETLRFLSK